MGKRFPYISQAFPIVAMCFLEGDIVGVFLLTLIRRWVAVHIGRSIAGGWFFRGWFVGIHTAAHAAYKDDEEDDEEEESNNSKDDDKIEPVLLTAIVGEEGLAVTLEARGFV